MASTVAPIAPIPETDEARSLIFRVAGRVYTCDLTAVREVVPLERVTRLPGTPAYVLGLVNVRGGIVTVLDAGVYLHGAPLSRTGSVLLVEHVESGRVAGVVVDAVADVRAVRDDEEYGWLDVRAIVARVIVFPEGE